MPFSVTWVYNMQEKWLATQGYYNYMVASYATPSQHNNTTADTYYNKSIFMCTVKYHEWGKLVRFGVANMYLIP